MTSHHRSMMSFFTLFGQNINETVLETLSQSLGHIILSRIIDRRVLGQFMTSHLLDDVINRIPFCPEYKYLSDHFTMTSCIRLSSVSKR
jgi:hypothetical protein